MALTKEERDKLPDSDFAVPGKRELPIQDEGSALARRDAACDTGIAVCLDEGRKSASGCRNRRGDPRLRVRIENLKGGPIVHVDMGVRRRIGFRHRRSLDRYGLTTAITE